MGVEPTRPSGQTVFGTVAAANRLASPNLATHCTISMQRSPGATRHSLQPKPPRCSAPVLCQILELHRDCGAGENRTPNARRQRCYRPRALHVLDTVEAIPDSRPPGEEGALLSRHQPTRSGESAQCRAEILHDAGSRAVKPQPTVTTLTGLTDHPADDARFALANLLRFTA